jgi:hypothetical protein
MACCNTNLFVLVKNSCLNMISGSWPVGGFCDWVFMILGAVLVMIEAVFMTMGAVTW